MACLWPASYGVNAGFRVFVASLLWGFGRVAEITIGRWAKVIIRGGMWGGCGGVSPGGYCRNGIYTHNGVAKTSLLWGIGGQK